MAFDFELTNEERHVIGLLKKGRSNAVSVRDLAVKTGLGGVAVRQVVRRLIMERGVLIASSVGDPPGYFIAETADEIITATKSLRHRGIMILMRAARLQKASVELVFNQARLEFEERKPQEVTFNEGREDPAIP